ncbi:hypothetical protein H4582DRAFT_2058415 [Lactarius indigo]|nr:hypothetical protein H4582DRAFT_2058415 [Lactarius indigo]
MARLDGRRILATFHGSVGAACMEVADTGAGAGAPNAVLPPVSLSVTFEEKAESTTGNSMPPRQCPGPQFQFTAPVITDSIVRVVVWRLACLSFPSRLGSESPARGGCELGNKFMWYAAAVCLRTSFNLAQVSLICLTTGVFESCKSLGAGSESDPLSLRIASFFLLFDSPTCIGFYSTPSFTLTTAPLGSATDFLEAQGRLTLAYGRGYDIIDRNPGGVEKSTLLQYKTLASDPVVGL